MEFSDLLYSSDILKTASIERPDGVQFETDFSNLAFAFLQDRATPLLEHLIGFEVVERSEDDTRAVGMFGFRVQGKFYYVPSFFVGGQVKGMESIYDKNKSQFYPLIEEWINDIAGKQTKTLGDVVSNRDVQDEEVPDLTQMTQPPGGLGNSGGGGFKMANAKETWQDMRVAITEAMSKDAAFKDMLQGALVSLHGNVSHISTQPSTLKQYIKQAGGPIAVDALLNTIINSRDFLKAAAEFYDLPGDFDIQEFDKTAASRPKAKTKKVTVISLDDGRNIPKGLNDTEKSILVRDHFVIKDTRQPQEQTEVLPTDYDRTFETPTESGKYNMLFSDGSVGEVSIALPANTSNDALVYLDKDVLYTTKTPNIIVQGEKSGDIELYNKAINLDKVLPDTDEKYILINDRNQVGKVLSIRNLVKDGERPIFLKVSMDTWFTSVAGCGQDSCRDNACDELFDGYFNEIKISNADNRKIHFKRDAITISDKYWKLLPLGKDLDKDKLPRPGSLSDFEYNRKEAGVHDLSIYTRDQLEYTISLDGVQEEPRSYKQAMVRLVLGYGLSNLDSVQLIKEAALDVKAKVWVKAAQIPPMDGVGVAMPAMPPQNEQVMDPFTGAPVEETQVDMMQSPLTGVDPMQDSMQPGFNMAENGTMGPGGADPMALAGQAADLGQKQVFDHSVIGGLASIHGTTELVDGFLPSFLETLDKMGRVLFLFFWKSDDFVERYGEEDFEDMEDKLKATYRQFGEMVFALNQKDINKNVE